jgi:hypothetical protein
MTKKKIINVGILEPHFHLKYLHTIIKICKIEQTKVIVFTTKELFSRLETYIDDKSKYEFVLKDENESMSSFLKIVEKICDDKIELLFVNTIQFSSIRLPPFFNFRPKSKMILTVHMTNHWLKQKFAFPTKNIFRSIDANISIFLIRKFVLSKYNAINVIYSPIKDHVLKNTDYKKPVFTLPFNFYDKTKKTSKLKKDEKIRFVIPGLIETYRRDYDLAIDVFEKLFKKYNKKISLWILGKPVGIGGNKIILRCEGLKKQGFDISFSKEFIPEEKYDKILTESDIIFSPLNVKAKRDTGILEIYGKTEGSALPFEAIQYCKPLIIPDEFNELKEMITSVLKYTSSTDLEKIITDIIENKKRILELSKEARKNSEKISLEILQRYFKKEILDKLEDL